MPAGVDCKSPAGHSAFADVDGLLELVETIAAETGLPVGIKSAVGQGRFWCDLAARMARTGTGVDFVTVDGGEGGTGAAPLVFTDHVALPFKWALRGSTGPSPSTGCTTMWCSSGRASSASRRTRCWRWPPAAT